MRVRHYIEPARMTREYLTRFYLAHGRTWIREAGIPVGVAAFGAPRWLWRKCAESYARYAFYRLSPRRVEALTGLRDFGFWRGAIQECRILNRERELS